MGWKSRPLPRGVARCAPLDADPKTCRHDGVKNSHVEGNVEITACAKCESTIERKILS